MVCRINEATVSWAGTRGCPSRMGSRETFRLAEILEHFIVVVDTKSKIKIVIFK